jgi:hypothetical protein
MSASVPAYAGIGFGAAKPPREVFLVRFGGFASPPEIGVWGTALTMLQQPCHTAQGACYRPWYNLVQP